MEVLHAIHTRRSIRQFKKTPVSDEVIEEVIAAGMMAPSGGNAQPWQFLVLRDAKLLATIGSKCIYAAAVAKAPAAVLVCGEPSREKNEGFWEQGCAAAVQNMLLAAHSLGLGSVWIAFHPRPRRLADIASLVSLPNGIQPFALLPLGIPAEEKLIEIRFDPFRIHYDRWDDSEPTPATPAAQKKKTPPKKAAPPKKPAKKKS